MVVIFNDVNCGSWLHMLGSVIGYHLYYDVHTENGLLHCHNPRIHCNHTMTFRMCKINGIMLSTDSYQQIYYYTPIYCSRISSHWNSKDFITQVFAKTYWAFSFLCRPLHHRWQAWTVSLEMWLVQNYPVCIYIYLLGIWKTLHKQMTYARCHACHRSPTTHTRHSLHETLQVVSMNKE